MCCLTRIQLQKSEPSSFFNNSWLLTIGLNSVGNVPTGPVELQVNFQKHDQTQTVLSVDLGSVHRNEEGSSVYRLEKADVMERNKWELIIMMDFHEGLVTTIKSKPFRITTRATQKARTLDEQDELSKSNIWSKRST